MKIKQGFFSRLALGLFIAVSLTVCGSLSSPVFSESADQSTGLSIDNPGIQKALEVQSRNTRRLMATPNVVGHGVGLSEDGRPVIKVFVKKAGTPGIPSALEGVPTRVEVTGEVFAYTDPTARFPRPVPIGVSTGHPLITAGTIGCRVTDGYNVYALSNNHVYAASNNAYIGDKVLQPGRYDGGKNPDDAIGTLQDFEPIYFSSRDNLMDAAIAVSTKDNLGTATPDDGYGTPDSTPVAAVLRQKVQKYGRTTGWTSGRVAAIKTTVNVCYDANCSNVARFVDQIGITPGTFSAGGDSGSLIVTGDANRNPVGLLFAGSSTYTFANRIDLVLDRFGVTVDNGATPDPPVNNSPKAAFSYAATGLTVKFTDESFDPDGDEITWHWVFGENGAVSNEKNPNHTYTNDGTYTVILTVKDTFNASDSVTETVTVSSGGESPEPDVITLTATAGKQNKTWRFVNLSWTGAVSANVDIYRNGDLVITTVNSGSYTDKIGNTSQPVTYEYQVCEEGTYTNTSCSNFSPVEFN